MLTGNEFQTLEA